jgi:hypothetical protein
LNTADLAGGLHAEGGTAQLIAGPKPLAVMHGVQTLHTRHVRFTSKVHRIYEHQLVHDKLLYNVHWMAEDVHCRTESDQAGLTFSKPGSAHDHNALDVSTAANLLQLLRVFKSAQITRLAVSTHGSSALPIQQLFGNKYRTGLNTDIATLAGILKNLPYELPQVSATMLDLGQLDFGQSPATAAVVPNELFSERDSASRGRVLFTPRMEYASSGGNIQQLQHLTTAFSLHRSFMVTGGLGGLGMLTAAWASLSGQGGTVLLGRSAHTSVVKAAQAAVAGGLNVAMKCDAAFSEDALAAASLGPMLGLQSNGTFHAAGLQVGRHGCSMSSLVDKV